MKIGEVIPKNGEIVINEGKETVTITVKHTGDRPVQVRSEERRVGKECRL